MSKKIKVPDMYDTYDFYEMDDKNNYKIVSKKGKIFCGWIRKICVNKDKIVKEK